MAGANLDGNTIAVGTPSHPPIDSPQHMSSRFFPRDEYFMRLALREAARAEEHDDVPIGCVIVKDGEVIATGHNERELRSDPTAHAELLALREAARALGSWRVLDAVLYVTLEPCAMCAGAIVLARVPRVIFGASDPKAGAAGSVLDVLATPSSTTARSSSPDSSATNARISCGCSSPPAVSRRLRRPRLGRSVTVGRSRSVSGGRYRSGGR